MCGRMTLTRSGSEIALFFAEAMALAGGAGSGPREVCEEDEQSLRPRFNLAPSQDVLTLLPGAIGTRDAVSFAWKRWGLVPSWAKDPTIGARMFNARVETADSKPSFRAAWKRRRCLVVADGFYEWSPKNRDHRPFHFRPSRGNLLGFAGLFETWGGEEGETIESCTVLTTEANADLVGVHHRMPVILDPERFAKWLDPEADPDALKALMLPAPAKTLRRRAVTRYVNDPRRDDARCLELESKAEQRDLFAPVGEEEEF
ncbi:MAG: hypothetical protein CL933_01190 [Deltaproteobacteria bacterium]|nr:hypothetical protein [Deltaproteobacteria bacterium]